MQQVVKCKPQVYTDDEEIKLRGRRPRGGTKRLTCSWRVGGMFLSKAALWGSPLTILAVPFGHVFALVRSRGQCRQQIDRGYIDEQNFVSCKIVQTVFTGLVRM